MCEERWVIYLRVSTKRQLGKDLDPDGLSIPAQLEACRRKAAEMGGEVVEVYIERAERARSAMRPELQRLLTRLQEGRDIDVIIVHKLDRWMRNVEDDVLVNIAIRQAGAELVSVSERFDNTAQGKFNRTIQAAVNQLYSDNLASEVMKGLVQKAHQGGTPYMAPTGYLNHREWINEKDIRTITVDPERAPHVSWAFERYSRGDISIIALTDMLAERGLTSRPTSKRPAMPLARSRVHGMLTRRFYIGRVVYQGVEYEGRHPALVSLEIFNRVQEVLRAHNLAGDRQRVHNHYLKGSLKCGVCGSRMTVNNARSKSSIHYLYFMCAARHRGTGCRQRYVQADAVERGVVREYATARRKLTAERLDQLREDFDAALRKHREALERDARRHRLTLKRLDHERAALVQMRYANAISLDLLKREQDRIAQEMMAAELVIHQAENGFAEAEAAIHTVLDLLADIQALYTVAPVAIRRQFNQALFAHFRVNQVDVEEGVLSEPLAALVGHLMASGGRPGRRDGGGRGAASDPVSTGRCWTREEMVDPASRMSNRPGGRIVAAPLRLA